jgi:hypothetical protein
MFELFISGGWQFMSLITLLALIMLFFAAIGAATIYGRATSYAADKLYYIRFFGMLALITGILGQIVGLYEAMKYIAQKGEVSQQILAAGIQISSIPTLYGFMVFLIAHLLWFILDLRNKSLKIPG